VVGIDDFAKLDIRVGKIIEVEDHPTARKPMYKLTVDFGAEVGKRTIVAGIRDKYPREELLGKKIVGIVNLDPKMIAGIESQGMMLAAQDAEHLSVLTVDRDVEIGGKVH
jgi:methionyl-tRNA synthetase